MIVKNNIAIRIAGKVSRYIDASMNRATATNLVLSISWQLLPATTNRSPTVCEVVGSIGQSERRKMLPFVGNLAAVDGVASDQRRIGVLYLDQHHRSTSVHVCCCMNQSAVYSRHKWLSTFYSAFPRVNMFKLDEQIIKSSRLENTEYSIKTISQMHIYYLTLSWTRPGAWCHI